MKPREIEVAPLTVRRWGDLATLFGPHGACGGCWCMWWRLARTEFTRRKGPGNRRAFKRIVNSGPAPGLLAYAGGQPVGWCAIGPRQAFPALDRSRLLKRVDETPVWSVPCFFVAKPFRHHGVATHLLRAAVKYARQHGAQVIEGYPIDPKTKAYPDLFAFTGLVSLFRDAGFVEIARRSKGRPIMRYGPRTRAASPATHSGSRAAHSPAR